MRPKKNPVYMLVSGLDRFIFHIFRRLRPLFPQSMFSPRKIQVTHIPVSVSNLPENFVGYRIVQLSDFHFGSFIQDEQLSAVIELVNSLAPDCCVITGDFISYNLPDFLDILEANLRCLDCPDGVFAILGNHDHASAPALIRQMLANAGITDLTNHHITLARDGQVIVLAGLDDILRGTPAPDQVFAALSPSDTNILLMHAPDFFDLSSETGKVSLQISGHSHGGQILFPGIGPLLLPPYGQKYIQGLHRKNGSALYISRGVGTGSIPFRWNCPPEIPVIELRKGEKHE